MPTFRLPNPNNDPEFDKELATRKYEASKFFSKLLFLLFIACSASAFYFKSILLIAASVSFIVITVYLLFRSAYLKRVYRIHAMNGKP